LAKTLVIMAGGAGSRFGGEKQLALLGPSGEILMEYSVYDALKAGFNRIVFVVRPGMQLALSPMLDKMTRAHPQALFICAEQQIDRDTAFAVSHPLRTKPLGTVHALLSAAPYIDGPFAVINADDYYGRQAFESMSMVMDTFTKSDDAALIVYSLKNTLSRHGTVTRGICDIEDGRLNYIREAYKVISTEEYGTAELIGDEYHQLPESSSVSMNFWAFHKDIIPSFIEYFKEFLTSLAPDDNKSECLLPIMAEHFIERGALNVRAIPTSCRWFGLTYKEDTLDAAWEIDKRHADGTYPEKLF